MVRHSKSSRLPQTKQGKKERDALLKGRLFTGLKNLDPKAVAEYKFHPYRQWRLDYYLPGSALAVEVEGGIFTGGRHTRPASFVKDVEKYNRVAMWGIRLYRIPAHDLADERKLLDHLAAIHIAQLSEHAAALVAHNERRAAGPG